MINQQKVTYEEKDDNLKGGNLIELPSLHTPTKPIGTLPSNTYHFKVQAGVYLNLTSPLELAGGSDGEKARGNTKKDTQILG